MPHWLWDISNNIQTGWGNTSARKSFIQPCSSFLLPLLPEAIERAVFKQVPELFTRNPLIDPYSQGVMVASPLKQPCCLWQKPQTTARAEDLSDTFNTVNHCILLCVRYSSIWASQAKHFLCFNPMSLGIASVVTART